MKKFTTTLIIAIFPLIFFITVSFAGRIEFKGANLLRPIQEKAIILMLKASSINLDEAEIEIFGEIEKTPEYGYMSMFFVTTTMLYEGKAFSYRGGLVENAAFEMTKRSVCKVIEKAKLGKGFD